MIKINNMKQFIVLILFFIFTASSFANEEKMKIGILYEKIFTTKKEAIIASRIWKKYTSKRGYKNVNVEFYDDESVLIADFLSNNISSVVVPYKTYYKNKSIFENISKRRWIPTLTKKIFEQYYLIKNKDSKVTLDNLNKNVLYYRNKIGKTWLDFLILKRYKKPMLNIFSKIVDIKKPQKLIFNVFFNKNALSIVSKRLYDDMLELNPQIKNRVEILEKSEQIFLSGIGFSHKKMDPYYDGITDRVKKDINQKGIVKLSESVKLHNVYNVSNKELKSLDSFFSEYLILKILYE